MKVILWRLLTSDLTRAVVAGCDTRHSTKSIALFPTAEDGVKGLAFVEVAIQSSALGKWKNRRRPAI